MTKTLHLVRHGKAVQDYDSIRDIDRPLTEKGVLKSVEVAGRLYAAYGVPDMIITSHAARAMHTAHIFARCMEYPADKILVNARLYFNGENEVRNILDGLDNGAGSVMIVGHNPGVTWLSGMYAGRVIDPLPTSGVATLRFETDRWCGIDGAKASCTVSFPEI